MACYYDIHLRDVQSARGGDHSIEHTVNHSRHTQSALGISMLHACCYDGAVKPRGAAAVRRKTGATARADQELAETCRGPSPTQLVEPSGRRGVGDPAAERGLAPVVRERRDELGPFVQHSALAHTLDGRHAVAFGTECNSWPICHQEQYRRSAAFRKCAAQGDACYLNSGVSAGTLRAWQKLAPQLLDAVLQGEDDQNALHQLLLNENGKVHVVLDHEHVLGFNVMPCPALRKGVNFSFPYACYENPQKGYDPLRKLHSQARYSASGAWPLLLHGPGRGHDLRRRLPPVLRGASAPRGAPPLPSLCSKEPVSARN